MLDVFSLDMKFLASCGITIFTQQWRMRNIVLILPNGQSFLKRRGHSNELDGIVSPLRVILAERRDRNSMYSSINRSSSRA
jgi:hypothetical protein